MTLQDVVRQYVARERTAEELGAWCAQRAHCLVAEEVLSALGELAALRPVVLAWLAHVAEGGEAFTNAGDVAIADEARRASGRLRDSLMVHWRDER